MFSHIADRINNSNCIYMYFVDMSLKLLWVCLTGKILNHLPLSRLPGVTIIIRLFYKKIRLHIYNKEHFE